MTRFPEVSAIWHLINIFVILYQNGPEKKSQMTFGLPSSGLICPFEKSFVFITCDDCGLGG